MCFPAGVAIFHSRDNIAPGRFQLFEQCVDVLKEVSAVFDYDGRYVALFHQVGHCRFVPTTVVHLNFFLYMVTFYIDGLLLKLFYARHLV